MFEAVKRFFEQIVHVLEYLPLLWRDRHWDYGFLIQLIVFKLEKMEKTILNNNLIADAEQVAKSIRVFRKLFERSTNEDWYDSLARNILERKWGEEQMFTVFERNSQKNTRHMCIFAPYDVIVNDEYTEYKKEYLELTKKFNKKAQYDLNKAFKIFKKYYVTWWD